MWCRAVEPRCGSGGASEPDVYGQFGQDATAATDMQREGLELLLELWTEEDVSWSGRFRPPLDGVTVEPRPVQCPHPPVYVACSSRSSAAEAARLGLGLTVTMLAVERSALPGLIAAYREAFVSVTDDGPAASGVAPRVTINCHVHVAPTSQEAYDHLGVYQFPFQRWVFAKRLGVAPDDVELPPRITQLSDPSCAIVCGSPAEVVDRIGRLGAVCEFDRFTYQGDYGGQPWDLVKRSLELFATDVMPQLP